MNFSDPDIARQMWVVNDDVMGGRSNSRIVPNPEGVVFAGIVSLDNGGGFASVRCPANFLEEASTLHLTARGDGKRYQLIVKTDLSSLAPLYKSEFVASNDWTTHVFDPRDFEASVRGRVVSANPLKLSDVRQVGILIAERQAGEFRIQLRQIQGL